MALMVSDVLPPEEQEAFREGMTDVEERCRREYGVDFLEATPEQRLAIVTELDQEQAAQGGSPPHYFRAMKYLSLFGYFTSEIGMTVAMQYVETPGRFDPCVPYTPGERNWAPHA